MILKQGKASAIALTFAEGFLRWSDLEGGDEIDFTRCTTIASRLWMASMTAGWVSVQSLINSGFQLNPRQGKKSTLNGTFGDQSSGWQCSDKTRTNKYIWYKRENHQTKRTFLILKQKPVSLLERSPEGGRFSILPF